MLERTYSSKKTKDSFFEASIKDIRILKSNLTEIKKKLEAIEERVVIRGD